ncbi:adenylate/guanylate cyclase domain-containing protein [Sneathiella sp. CAU 1612]|uniref:Adenylate/guanylate cyclase domain-containing protein n=1 Tax=Sneathiella sedimenti TaxID=2816034 RepID=A0ABS3FBA2_9PROT|nr:adenylate/guanylate cyclase domain-containing protein [Sneathiella sedimenti]MBO0335351.1 adenylate/guanylate cyclase domain-containing protein [Sneathiella sedimenti]
MGTHRTQRQLAAIMSVDVVGFSRLMGVDEEGTLEALKRLRQTIVSPQVAHHQGRIVKLMGDGAIIIFSSVVDAVSAGIAIQQAMNDFNNEISFEHTITMRIGINLGDVILEGKDIYGDGVNVAARIQELCTPGGIALSATAYEHVNGKVNADFVDVGERVLKNITRKIRVFRWPDTQTTESPPRLSLPDKPSIVVLPFDNMSNDPDQEYFADGVVESLTAALSRIRSFFVIARNSAFAYKGRHMNIIDIGRELGVGYLLEGSVQRASGKLRITVQLVESTTGAHLWAEKYDGADSELFDLQDRITEQVAGALQPSIQKAEIDRATRKRPHDMGAYDYAMRAIRQVWMQDQEESAVALKLLEKSLAIDPDYPLALALSAWCWAQHSVYNWTDDIESAKTRALHLAEKAAAFSTDDPLILSVLGVVHTFARNHGTARIMLERAIKLDPNAAWALSRLGWLEVYADRPEAAFQHFEHAIRLSPLDPMNFNNLVGIASAHQISGDYSASANLFERALMERPNAFWIYRNLAPALLAAGRREDAEAAKNHMLKAYPAMTIKRFKDAMVFSPKTLEGMAVYLRKLGIPEE